MKLDTKALAYSLHPTVMPSVFLFFSSSSGSAGVYTSCSTVIIEQEKSSALPLSLFSSVYIESPSFLIAARHSLYRSNFLRKSSSSGSCVWVGMRQSVRKKVGSLDRREA